MYIIITSINVTGSSKSYQNLTLHKEAFRDPGNFYYSSYWKLLFPVQVKVLFPIYKDCLYSVRQPHVMEVINFLKPIIDVFYLDLNMDESKSIIPPIEQGNNDLFFSMYLQ